MSDEKKGQVIYFSHGGGPMPLLGDSSHRKMITFMEGLNGRLRMPEEILVISAHWEESTPSVIGGGRPPLLYDYYGFPESTYNLEYDAPGHPKLADAVLDCLKTAGIKGKSVKNRGFDHGLFVPLMLIYPKGKIPATQLSLRTGLDPETHLKMGRALAPLLKRNILIIGSGFSFHNMEAFIWGPDKPADDKNNRFQEWLTETCAGEMPREEREERLAHWEKAPGARYCHPREEHLMPLHVCAGAAGAPGQAIFDDYILGKRSLAFYWDLSGSDRG